jgi:exopolysaccharide biosynthesis polyprenyl glycosylphosphotransferase
MPSLADELLFQRLLMLERRRCERTEGHFGLLLIHMEELKGTISPVTMEEIGCMVGGMMRETDITGWYESGSIVGVILTTLNEASRDSIESVVVERVSAVLSERLTDKQLQKVEISCHIFPEDRSANRIFYTPDRDKKSKGKSVSFIKRAMDITGSLIALLFLAPVFFLIAVLIKATSEGPVFFRQKRVGQFGEEFTFLKFRSMHVNNDPAIHKQYIENLIQKKISESSGTFKIKNDPRVTPVGRILRKTSMDELPQFFNVLQGNMSLVGPRPPIPYEFETYYLWHRRRILEAKPGITGEWQVHGRSRTTFDDMVRMDLHYIRNQSIWVDLKILLKTPFAVISGDGAY